MVVFVAYPLATFPSKLAIFRSNFNEETRSTSFNVPCISSRSQSKVIIVKENNNVLYPSPLKKSSVIHHDMPYKQFELQPALENIRHIMARKSAENDQLEELIMIDVIQRLGLEWYFQDEIHAAMERHYFKDGGDLHEVALRFRLLRQQGYNVTSDVFNKFKNNEGNFTHHHNDLRGLLSLFEASHLSTESENVMDEAQKYGGQVLKASLEMDTLEQRQARIIEYTLRNPFHRRVARILPKSIVEDFKIFLEFVHGLTNIPRDWVKDVQDLATIDFEMDQTSQNHEILQVSKWVIQHHSTMELGFARIQPFKWYIRSFGILPAPNMSKERVELTKVVSFIYIIDDMFDVYGTLDELSLFTDVVKRWEYANVDRLPSCMKACFKALHNMVKDISHRTYIMFGWNPEDSLRKAWGDLCNAYLMEAKWLASGKLPSSEEYLKNGITTVGVPVVLMHAFFLLGQGITKTSVDALNEIPVIVSSSAKIIRLWNDTGTFKDTNQDGIDGSYIDCYMSEHKGDGISVESAREHANEMISDAWKCLNKELLSPTCPFSADFKTTCLNLARMASAIYSIEKSHYLLDLRNRFNCFAKKMAG